MAAPGGKAALSSRLASMGFMKRAAAGQQQAQAPSGAEGTSLREHRRAQSHAADLTPKPAVDQAHVQQAAADMQPDGKQQPKKYALSDKLTSMKFMQRGKPAKRGFEEAIGQQDEEKQQAEWVAPAAADGSKSCIVIQERDPLPAGVLGRMSFGNFNLETEALQQSADAAASGKPLQAAAANAAAVSEQHEGVSVTDDDMAGWGKGKKVLSSLRMGRSGHKPQKRQRVH